MPESFRIDDTETVFKLENIQDKARKSLFKGLKDECTKKEYIDSSDISDDKLHEFLKNVWFVVDDKEPKDYIKEIIKSHPKIIPQDSVLISIFNEIRNKQSEKKNTLVEGVVINQIDEVLAYGRHLTNGEIRLLVLQRIINNDPLSKGIPAPFFDIYSKYPEESRQNMVEQCQRALCMALFNKSTAQGFWKLDYKEYYYYLEFESSENKYTVIRRGDSYIVSSPTGIRLFEDYSEFKRFWNSEIFSLPQITFQGHKKIVDMELFSQLFFIGQDGKDTSTIFNSGFYHKDDFKEMVCSFAGDGEAEISSDELQYFRLRITSLESQRRDQLALSEFYKTSTPAKEYLSRIQDQEAFHDRVRELETITEQMSNVRKNRNRLATKKSLWNGTLKELRSLNRNIDVGELRCMECDSSHIAYKGKGKMTYFFDVSTPEMRSQIIASIEERIAAYNEEIDKYDFEIGTLQKRIDEVMNDEDVTIENILAYKNGFSDTEEIEEKVAQLDAQIKEIKEKIRTGTQQTADSKQSRDLFYKSVITRMNEIKHQIDTESDQDYEDIFTKRGSVVSGSEETVYYISRLISIAELTNHECPIIMDSFRAEDLSTEKEERVLKILKKMNRQCILTTTLKELQTN